MNQRTLIQFSERVQDIGEQCSDLFAGEVERLKREHGVDAPQHLAETFAELGEANRLLNIGFVGRVKAGKSSLLNALFFQGKSVLPKAATPMTAALTTLTYGDNFAAKVEFFGEEDLRQIQELDKQYTQQLQAKTEQYFADIHKHQKISAEPTGKPVDEAKVRSLAERQALNEMKRTESLAAAHEQALHMRTSGVDPSTLTQSTQLDAANSDELVGQLMDYVGAKGRFMPFTKIVHVYMPLETLRDIRVIDTPGTNDPVVSREARTISLLKTCDVVFVVSPAGQFLNEDDLTLLNRITLKEGVQELALVASQVDSQLHDSEKRTRLDDALNSVRSNLSAQARRNLGDLTRNNPEGSGVFGALLNSVEAGLLHSAGICMTLEKQLETPETWGSEEKKAWENLVESYPDYFNLDNSERSRVNLRKLSNISHIGEKLAAVRLRKDAITKNKLDSLSSRKEKGLENFRAALASLVHSQISQIKSSDIDELRSQLKVLNFQQFNLERELDMTYDQCMHQYRTDLRTRLMSKANTYLHEMGSKISTALESKNETETRQKRGVFNTVARILWEGGSEQIQVTRYSVMTMQVTSALEKYVNQVKVLLSDEVSTARKQLDQKLGAELTPVVRQVLEENCNPELIARAIGGVVDSLYLEPFDLGIRLPGELHNRGTLKGKEAKEFMDEANSFVYGLENIAVQKISQFIQRLEKDVPKKISDIFIAALTVQTRMLEEQLNNFAQTIERLEKTSRDLEGVAS